MAGRPRKQVELKLSRDQCQVVLRALLWCPSSVKSEEALAKAQAKVHQAYCSWEQKGGGHVIVSLTEGQGRAVLATLVEYGRGVPSTGAWRSACRKAREALGVWEEYVKP